MYRWSKRLVFHASKTQRIASRRISNASLSIVNFYSPSRKNLVNNSKPWTTANMSHSVLKKQRINPCTIRVHRRSVSNSNKSPLSSQRRQMSNFALFCTGLGAVAMYTLLILPEKYFWAGFESTPELYGIAEPNKEPDPSNDGIYRKSLTFESNGIELDGWLYVPIKDESLASQQGKFPVVVMAHGFGQTRDWGLYKYATAFAQNGIATFVFDYGTFGGSKGTPRHNNNPNNLINDYLNGINFIRDENNDQVNINEIIDNSRVGIWGTSYSGGHVLPVAAKICKQQRQMNNNNDDLFLKCVISQVPYMGALPNVESKYASLLPLKNKNTLLHIWGATSDVIRNKINMYVIVPIFGEKYAFKPLYAKLFGNVDNVNELSLIYYQWFDETKESFSKTMPKSRTTDWRNAMLLRSVFDIFTYQPIVDAPNIDENVKILYVTAKHDKICPNHRTEWAYKNTKNGQFIQIDSTHMEIYGSDPFEQATKQQIQFLRESLALESA